MVCGLRFVRLLVVLERLFKRVKSCACVDEEGKKWCQKVRALSYVSPEEVTARLLNDCLNSMIVDWL